MAEIVTLSRFRSTLIQHRRSRPINVSNNRGAQVLLFTGVQREPMVDRLAAKDKDRPSRTAAGGKRPAGA